MTETDIETALADAINREHAARVVGAADQQAQAMGEIRALRLQAIERERVRRLRWEYKRKDTPARRKRYRPRKEQVPV
jgi:hypothetical protein